MKSKKGAIELSMTTIIVIVIGITLLTLGLTWVRSTLGKVTDLTDEAFKMSDQEITNMFSNSAELLKIVPDTATMKKGKSVDVTVVLYNLEEGSLEFQAKTYPVENGVDLSCNFVETGSADSRTRTINSGAFSREKLRITTTKQTTLGYGGCVVEITSLTNADTDYQLSQVIAVDVEG